MYVYACRLGRVRCASCVIWNSSNDGFCAPKSEPRVSSAVNICAALRQWENGSGRADATWQLFLNPPSFGPLEKGWGRRRTALESSPLSTNSDLTV